MTNTKPATLDGFDNIDTMTAVATVVTIPAAKLRGGMVLVDDLDCPTAGVDHRVRATRNTGAVAFLVHDFDARALRTVHIRATASVRVMAG